MTVFPRLPLGLTLTGDPRCHFVQGTALARHLLPDGVFGLWSNDPPNDMLEATLAEVFDKVEAHVVPFPNPYLRRDSACTVYVAIEPRQASHAA